MPEHNQHVFVSEELHKELLDYITTNNINGHSLQGQKHKEFAEKLYAAYSFISTTRSISSAVLWCVKNNIRGTVPCEICGTHHAKVGQDRMIRFCSKKCSTEHSVNERVYDKDERSAASKKARETRKQKTGYASNFEDPAWKAAYLQKKSEECGYTVTNISQTPERIADMKQNNPMFVPEYKERAIRNSKQSLMDNHGVDNPVHVSGSLAKREETSILLYGETHPMKSSLVKHKMLDAKRSNSSLHNGTSDEVISFILSDKFVDSCNSVGVMETANIIETTFNEQIAYQTLYKYIRKYNIQISPPKTVSSGETMLYNELSKYVQLEQSNRSLLGSHEVDMVSHEHKICIEFDGIYWHSTLAGKDASYHLTKTEKLAKLGYRLIHVFENEYNENPDIVTRMILSSFGIRTREAINARECKVVELSNDDVRDFYDNTHIQGSVNASVGMVYGLIYNNELVAAMSFNKTRREYVELVRFATSKDVRGGFSKLLQHFFKINSNIDRIVSFADIRWSDGKLYTVNGFTHVENTQPNYYYVTGQYLTRKENFRKSKMPSLIEKGILKFFDESLTEFENMDINKIGRIYDCGLMKFEKHNPFYTH